MDAKYGIIKITIFRLALTQLSGTDCFKIYATLYGLPGFSRVIGLAGGNRTIYGYVWNPIIQIDVFGLNIVEHFPDFDAALKRAFELATGGDPTVTFTSKRYDPLTGTEVEFIGTNKSKIAFDSPYVDMRVDLGHDKPHIGFRQVVKE